MMSLAGCWRCTSGGGRGRRVGAVVGRCDPRAPAGDLGGPSDLRAPGAPPVAQEAVALPGNDLCPGFVQRGRWADRAEQVGADGTSSALGAADAERVGTVEALGLDETLFGRCDPWRARQWYTSVVNVTQGQLLDIVPGRDAEGPTRWLVDQPGTCAPEHRLGTAGNLGGILATASRWQMPRTR